MVEASYGSSEGEDRAYVVGHWKQKDCAPHRRLMDQQGALVRGLGIGRHLSLLAEAKADRAPRRRALGPGEQLALPPAPDEAVYRAAFTEGVTAHAGGDSFGTCPYPDDGPAHQGWRAGWWD